MPDSKHCPHCGVVLGVDAPGGLCLRCLAELGAAHPVHDSIADEIIASDEPQASGPSRIIGDYELLDELGHGGMGIVYRARQLSLGREVAFKLIKPGMDSTQVLGRFDAERAALARMDHPNIARVIDAGKIDLPLSSVNPQLSTSLGRPYFVMELVQGIPITRYCDEQRLPLRERLDLFMSVCHAIQHAHVKGIIHRDIKPSNVLVTRQDGKATPKVIDFGVAKAIGPRLTRETLATEIGAVIGTLEYMSPEQARLDQLDIDTRSDIYALGILLYELLTGTTPLNRQTLKQAAFDEVLRVIREQEPPRPSTRVTEQLAASTAAPTPKSQNANRQSKIPPDLDWIVMKALEKDRTRRYETATGFAQDVHRYLRDEPVLASPPSKSYRMWKWIRRNPAIASLTAALLLTLALGNALVLRQLGHTERARRQAEAITRFLTETFQGAGPSVALGRDTKLLRDILSVSDARVTRSLADQPEAQAKLLKTLGSVYSDIGDQAEAEALLQRSLDLWRRLHRGDHAEIADTINALGLVHLKQGNVISAESLLRQALRMREHVLGSNHPDTAETLANLAAVLAKQGQDETPESLLRRALGTFQSGDNSHDPRAAAIWNQLGLLLNTRQRYSEAQTAFSNAVVVARLRLPANHPHLADFLNNLAVAHQKQGRKEEAAPFYLEALRIQEIVFGADDAKIAITRNNLAFLLRRLGEYKEAEKLYHDALAALDREGKQIGQQLKATNTPPALRSALEKRDVQLTWDRAHTRAHLVRTLLDAREFALAEPHARRLLDTLARGATNAWEHADAQSLLGAALLGLKRYDDARPLLEAGYQTLQTRKRFLSGYGPTAQGESLERLAWFYQERGTPEQAVEWKQRLDDFRQPPAPATPNEAEGRRQQP